MNKRETLLSDIESCYNSILRNDNFQAKIDIEDINKEAKEIIQRINKAIEYIKPYRMIEHNIGWIEFTLEDKIKLLEILGDGNNEMD